MDDKILVANHIYKNFGGVQALKDVGFEVAPQEIHCLVGENGSGKSTFVKTVAGVHAPDQGEIILNGHKYSRISVREAIHEGIQVIYQDMSLFPNMNVIENIAINKMLFDNRRMIDWKEARRIAEQQLERIGVSMNLRAPVETLSIANRQLVAICRALSLDAKILFMDEPTTALTRHEVDRLLSIVIDLKKKGMSVVFISHKLDEVMKVADQIAIFRDGEKVGDFKSGEINEKTLIYHMTGRKIEYTRYSRKNQNDQPILQVKNLTKKGNYKNISFDVREGDVLGIIGLLGAGRTELTLTMFGLNPQDSGEILFNHKRYKFKSPKQPIKLGISLLPENRQTQGCFLRKSVSENVASAVLYRLKGRMGIIDRKAQEREAVSIVKKLRIITKDIDSKVQNLSGGNQQKVVLGKWIASRPRLLILDSPTVGVDVGSKSEIYEHIQQLAGKGLGIIMISDEISEILANCNKLIVMRGGEMLAMLDEDDLNQKGSAQRIYEILNLGEQKSNIG